MGKKHTYNAQTNTVILINGTNNGESAEITYLFERVMIKEIRLAKE